MRKKIDFILVAVTLFLYCVNQVIKTDIPYAMLRYFMCCYFNDLIGSITFAAYTDIILGFIKQKLDRLWKIELLLLGCGFFWEVITPLFRANTVSDIWDVVVYLGGGLLYYCAIEGIE